MNRGRDGPIRDVFIRDSNGGQGKRGLDLS